LNWQRELEQRAAALLLRARRKLAAVAGRLIYVGAGTSGRLAVQDGADDQSCAVVVIQSRHRVMLSLIQPELLSLALGFILLMAGMLAAAPE
jgi:hypothetical protein